MPDGSAILDVPCGGGTAFRGLRPGQRVKYVAADISPAMLERARGNAARRGLDQIEFVETDVASLPFEDASFDLCLCLNSLHNFPDPRAAIAEVARCLKPGGRLVAECAVRGVNRRYDFVFRLYQRSGIFGPGGTESEMADWLRSAGLETSERSRSGAVARIAATRRA
jgi:ubiquinone/menaquinone biosynthesis C-methylase UbiE